MKDAATRYKAFYQASLLKRVLDAKQSIEQNGVWPNENQVSILVGLDSSALRRYPAIAKVLDDLK